jgi:chorismate mutase
MAAEDPVLREARERLDDVDRRIVAALNERLELVRDLWRHKADQGLPVLAPDREQALLDRLARENPGPLSEEGVRRIYGEVLALMKRELGQS